VSDSLPDPIGVGLDVDTLDADTKEKVANEQLRMVWSHAAVGTLVATAFAILMAIHFRGVISERLVDFWIAMKVLVAAPRVVQAQVFRRRGFPGGDAWRMGTYWLLALDGAVWGAAGFWLMDFDVATASLAIASLGCVACVATFGLQVSRVATAAYVVPIIAPMVVGMLMRADQLGIYYAVGLSLLLTQVLISANRSDAKLSEVFQLRIHAARISAERAQALELVQRQSAVKTQFLGTVSHELRTPIHGMLGVARLVHVETADPLVKKRMELIEASGTHLLGLVTDLIDVSRIDSGQMRIQRIAFDLWSEVERVADIYSVRAAEKGLAFTLDSQLKGPTWVIGDPVRMRQVLHNLLGNAIKFTNEGWVQLMVGPGAHPGQVHFKVRDTGVGISEEDQKVVFDAFHQVGSRVDGRRQGTGLGLTIAHEIAHLLGGGITLRSKPGFGSIFDFMVQFELASAPSHADSRSQMASDGVDVCARILLVEDNDVNFLIASSMLANQGHQVERASDGAEAVRRGLREIDRPDLILMDCMMPTMDGFEATRSIRIQETAMGLARVPIIALSAIIDEDMGRKAINAGMDDTLGKPFSNEDLRRVIRPWLALRESERQGALDGLSRSGGLVDQGGPPRS
jgi:signal transduction histidine kinase/AmiR/NasT family two-component response regulator